MKKIAITTGVIAIAGGITTALLMPSCEPECEVIDKPSVIVKLVDKDAAEATLTQVAADEVWYEWTNEDGVTVNEKAACLDDECTEWMLGDGAPGHYEFHAKVCGRQFDSSVTVELNQAGCEVDTQLIDLSVSTVDCPDVLAPEPPVPPTSGPTERDLLKWQIPSQPTCTMEARFSVIASLYTERDGRMVPVGADRAYFIHDPREEQGGNGLGHDKGKGLGHEIGKGKGHDKDGEFDRGEEIPAMCFDQACTRFGAGLELEGTFIVGAEACGQIVETTVTVGRTEDGCHVQTQRTTLNFDGVACKGEPIFEATPPKSECPTTMAPPSAYIFPVYQEGDMLISKPTASLFYTGDDIRGQGYCAREAANDLCALWIAGWGLTGDFKAYTEACGEQTAISYTVDLAADGCGPETEYVLAYVDTRGCIVPASPEGHPPPTTPAAGHDVTK